MTWFRCPNCQRRGEESGARTGSTRTTWGEPGYDFDACKVCAPDGDDIQRAKDHADERREAEAREA